MKFLIPIKSTPQLKAIAVFAMILSGFYLLIGLSPPFLYYIGSMLASGVRALGGMICHQKPSRCFWIFDFPCGLCVKCLGFYFGVFVSSILFFVNRLSLELKYSFALCCALAVVITDSIFGFMPYSEQVYIVFIFVLSAIGSFGLFLFAVNKIAFGGKIVQFFVKKSVLILFIFIILDLYGFSRAFGEVSSSVSETNTPIVIPAATGVILGVIGDVSTKNYREGDAVPLQVTSPVRVKDTVVIRGGTPARGLVAVAHAASSWGGAGELVIEAKSVQAIDGTEILLTGATSRHGETSHGTSAAVAVGTGILCLPLALTGAAVKGEEGRVMTGFELVARTLNDQTIHIPSEVEQSAIQKQQESLARQQRIDADARTQKLKEEEERKKKKANSKSDN